MSTTWSARDASGPQAVAIRHAVRNGTVRSLEAGGSAARQTRPAEAGGGAARQTRPAKTVASGGSAAASPARDRGG